MCSSQGANFAAGGRELFASRSREADDSVLVNGARGTRDIEGKVTRVGASEHGLRMSFKTERKRNPQLLTTHASNSLQTATGLSGLFERPVILCANR